VWFGFDAFSSQMAEEVFHLLGRGYVYCGYGLSHAPAGIATHGADKITQSRWVEQQTWHGLGPTNHNLDTEIALRGKLEGQQNSLKDALKDAQRKLGAKRAKMQDGLQKLHWMNETAKEMVQTKRDWENRLEKLLKGMID
jgi:hypothetical protein